MNKNFLVLQCEIPSTAADWIGTLLSDLGCEGVVVASTFEAQGLGSQPEKEVGIQSVQAYFPEPEQTADLVVAVHQRLRGLEGTLPGWSAPEPMVEQVGREDWAEGWKQHFSPLRVGPVLIRPSWWEGRVDPAPVELVIDPGMAFGTGSHSTTRLCLQELIASCQERVPQNLLDVGTGSGILAMAGARLGIPRVLGCDNDPVALDVAVENLAANGLQDRVDLSLTPLAELPGRYQLVLANILAETNIALAAALVSHLTTDGLLILSGILAEQATEVRAAFADYPLEFLHRSDDQEWVALVYQKVS